MTKCQLYRSEHGILNFGCLQMQIRKLPMVKWKVSCLLSCLLPGLLSKKSQKWIIFVFSPDNNKTSVLLNSFRIKYKLYAYELTLAKYRPLSNYKILLISSWLNIVLNFTLNTSRTVLQKPINHAIFWKRPMEPPWCIWIFCPNCDLFLPVSNKKCKNWVIFEF